MMAMRLFYRRLVAEISFFESFALYVLPDRPTFVRQK